MDARIKSGHDELLRVDVAFPDIPRPSRRALRARFTGIPALVIERAQGMPGAGWHPQPRVQMKKAHECVTAGIPGTSGIPRAMVLTASFVISSVSRAFLPPSPARCEASSPG